MTYRIALIPGDGIGKELVPEGVRVLDALEEVTASMWNSPSFPTRVDTIWSMRNDARGWH